MHPRNYIQDAKNKGFTLVELAIVIVIIGLLTGGVLAGQELVKQAEIRNLVKAVDSYIAAKTTFQAKYNCLPGDCNKASTFFGAACDATASNCDGDGDNLVVYNYTAFDNETLRFWQHLVLGKMLAGNYLGSANGGGYEVINGKAVPKAPFKDVYIAVRNDVWYSSNASKNLFMVGKWNNSSNAVIQAPFAIPEDAYALDLKIDDGMPITGSVYTFPIANAAIPNCHSGINYNIAYANIACNMMWSW